MTECILNVILVLKNFMKRCCRFIKMLKKITVLYESRVSTSGNEYFAYDIAQEVTASVDKQQSDNLTNLATQSTQATETVPAPTDADLPF